MLDHFPFSDSAPAIDIPQVQIRKPLCTSCGVVATVVDIGGKLHFAASRKPACNSFNFPDILAVTMYY
jgi:hypothetical protein